MYTSVVGIVNDLYKLHLTDLVWTQLVATGAAGAPPLPRLFFGFSATPDGLYVFGGSGDYQVSLAISKLLFLDLAFAK